MSEWLTAEYVKGLIAWFPTSIDEGWATLIGAVLAAAIAVRTITAQARLGFDSLVKSQENQSKLDREARKEQADLDRQAREHLAEIDKQATANRRLEEKQVLASALAGELVSVTTTVQSARRFRGILISFSERTEFVPDRNLARHIHNYRTPIFDATISQLGILGPSIASDIISCWNFLKAEPLTEKVEFPDKMAIVALLKALQDGADEWLQDAVFVHKRLISVYTGSQDPGALYFEKQRKQNERAEAGTQVSNNAQSSV